MGQIARASCSRCNYEKDAVFGGGMFDYKTNDPFPHYCEKCRIMFSGNLLSEEEIVCPRCGTADVIPYYDKRICKVKDKKLDDTGGKKKFFLADVIAYYYKKIRKVEDKNLDDTIGKERFTHRDKCLCPACGNFSLEFETYMSYD